MREKVRNELPEQWGMVKLLQVANLVDNNIVLHPLDNAS